MAAFEFCYDLHHILSGKRSIRSTVQVSFGNEPQELQIALLARQFEVLRHCLIAYEILYQRAVFFCNCRPVKLLHRPIYPPLKSVYIAHDLTVRWGGILKFL